jgi:hypothetical protein
MVFLGEWLTVDLMYRGKEYQRFGQVVRIDRVEGTFDFRPVQGVPDGGRDFRLPLPKERV